MHANYLFGELYTFGKYGWSPGHLVTWDPVGLASVFVRMLYLHGPHRLAKGAQELQRSWEAGEGSGATCTAVWVRAS